MPYPPAARERMIGIAVAEWQDWGGLEPSTNALPQAGPESDPINFPRVLAYWSSVPEGPLVIARHRAVFSAWLADGATRRPTGLWTEPPWSAAFISYVVRAAGVDRAEFPPAAAHATYIDALLAQAAAFPAQAPFLPHAPGDHAATAGDLLCGDRSATPLTHWTERLAEAGRFRPMHCDLVVAAGDGTVSVVGGNVADAVLRRHFAADAAGKVLPRPSGEAPLILLLESRLGRLPPWGPATFVGADLPQAWGPRRGVVKPTSPR